MARSPRRHSTLLVQDLPVTVVRKAIRNLHIRVYPPHGEVRVSAPRLATDAAVRDVLAKRLPWIRRQQERVRQGTGPCLEFLDGEIHRVEGRPCLLRVLERPGRTEVRLEGEALELRLAPGSSLKVRQEALWGWHRRRLAERIAPLAALWEPRLGVRVDQWRIRRMKTRWGTCSIAARRIWLNLELARQPPECLEYVLVHEMVHLHERLHNDRFRGLMDLHLPDWRDRRRLLNGGR